MSIYVDDPMSISGKWHGGCHMIADNLDELHAFASRLGLKRSWFQPRSWPHYDLTANKRKAAVEMGATVVSGRRAIEILKATYPRPQTIDVEHENS